MWAPRADCPVNRWCQGDRFYVNDGHGRVSLRLLGRLSNRDGYGATVRIQTSPGVIQREVHGGNGYGGAGRLVHIGIGPARKIERLIVTWPSGVVQTLGGIAANGIVILKEP